MGIIGFLGIGSLAKGALWQITFWFLNVFLQIILSINYGLTSLLNYVLYARIYYSLPVIEASWKIIRDFTNMFFIVALIVMAFATIFDVESLFGWAGYDVRKMFTRFIIAAVLINFSLVIGGLIIDGTQVVNNVFLTAIGSPGDRLGQILCPSVVFGSTGIKCPLNQTNLSATVNKSFTVNSQDQLDSIQWYTLIARFFSIILMSMIAFSLATAVIFAFVRIPILWFLLVISPIAWLTRVFPGTKQNSSDWWKHFMAWNLYLPIFLFFLYFGLYFLQNQAVVLNSIFSSTTGSNTILEGVGYSVQTIFLYVMAAIFITGGTAIARKGSLMAGGGVTKVATGIHNWTRQRVSNISGYTSRKRAVEQRLSEIQKEGLPFGLSRIYGGEAAIDRRTAKFSDRYGGWTGGKTDARDRQRMKDVEDQKKKIENLSVEQLRSQMSRGTTEQRLAARELLKEKGALTAEQIIETYNMYGGSRSIAARKFGMSIDYAKLQKSDRETINEDGAITDPDIRRKLNLAMAEKGDLAKKTAEEIKAITTTLYQTPNEQREFLDKMKKNNLMASLKVKEELGLLGNKDNGDPKTYQEELINEAKKLSDKDIGEISSSMLKDSGFQEALEKAITTRKRLNGLSGKLTEEKKEALKILLEKLDRQLPRDTRGEQAEEESVSVGEGDDEEEENPEGTAAPVKFNATDRKIARLASSTDTNENNILDLRNK